MAHRTTARVTVAVCGSSTLPAVELEDLAESVGEEVLRAGMNLVTGGLKGVMEAASRGAARARDDGEGDGIVLGILPGSDKSAANPYCDMVIPTGLGIARNLLVVAAADAVIIVHGGSGTLSEAAFAWQLGKPVVALTVESKVDMEAASSAMSRRPRIPMGTLKSKTAGRIRSGFTVPLKLTK
jgi:uncharacterized protein (TIGR00725 family)